MNQSDTTIILFLNRIDYSIDSHELIELIEILNVDNNQIDIINNHSITVLFLWSSEREWIWYFYHFWFPLLFLILLVGLQIILFLLLLLLLFFSDRILIVHSSTILSSLESSFICKEQKCNSIEYNQYLSFVPLEYRVCDECEVELDCYHRFGKPFSFRTINNKNYPTIPYGSGMEYLCVPYLNLHSHYRLLILVVSAAKEMAPN